MFNTNKVNVEELRNRFKGVMGLRRRAFKDKSLVAVRKNIWAFLPGCLFLALGLAALITPKLILAIAAAFFLCVGGVFCFLGWKVLQIKKRIDIFTQQFEGRVVLHGVTVEGSKGKGMNNRDPFESDIPAEFTVRDGANKKIVYH